MSIQENILNGIKVSLSGLSSGRVYRDRKEQIGTLPAICIEPESCEESEAAVGLTDGYMFILIMVYAAGDTPSSAADSLIASVKAVMIPGADFALGNNVQLLPSVTQEWDFENFDYVRVSLRYRVQYRS